MTIDLHQHVRNVVYGHLADTGRPPVLDDIAQQLDAPKDAVADALKENAERHFLVLNTDGRSIRMASPFSGVPTPHVIESDGVRYFANCGWDAFGVVAALGRSGTIHSRCEQSKVPLELTVDADGPPPSEWVFHSELPAAMWWQDIIYT